MPAKTLFYHGPYYIGVWTGGFFAGCKGRFSSEEYRIENPLRQGRLQEILFDEFLPELIEHCGKEAVRTALLEHAGSLEQAALYERGQPAICSRAEKYRKKAAELLA